MNSQMLYGILDSDVTGHVPESWTQQRGVLLCTLHTWL